MQPPRVSELKQNCTVVLTYDWKVDIGRRYNYKPACFCLTEKEMLDTLPVIQLLLEKAMLFGVFIQNRRQLSR